MHAKCYVVVSLPVADFLRHQSGFHQDQYSHHFEGNRQGIAIHLCHLGPHRCCEHVERRRRHHAAGQVQPHPVKLDRQRLLYRLGRFCCPL